MAGAGSQEQTSFLSTTIVNVDSDETPRFAAQESCTAAYNHGVAPGVCVIIL